MKVIVTGGNGFLGRWVVKALQKAGHQTTSLDVAGDGGIHVDLEIYSHTRSALAQIMPGVIIHLAALAGATGKGGGAESMKSPHAYFKVNTMAALNVFEACRELNIKKVICMSSFSPYGKAFCPITERTPLNPLNAYGGSKVNVETIAKVYARAYGIKTLIFRAPLICGEGQKETNAIREFASCAVKGEPIVVWGDGSTIREFVHPSDVARAYLLGLKHLEEMKEPYNTFVLGNTPVTMRDLAREVVHTVGKGSVKFLADKPKLFDQFTKRTKVELKLGWVPKTGVKQIIERVAREMMVVA